MSEWFTEYAYDEYSDWPPAPTDSYDLYAMGLRAARCNGCRYKELKYKLGDKFLVRVEGGWPTVYELDAEPNKNQRHTERKGRPIQFKASFMSIEHSDECYHWTPPKEG